MNNEETIELIKATLDKVRPFINRDGGDVEFVDFKDGFVYINMLGACDGCSLVNSTISEGIEIILMDEWESKIKAIVESTWREDVKSADSEAEGRRHRCRSQCFRQ